MNNDILFCIALFILISWVFVIEWKLRRLEYRINEYYAGLNLVLFDLFERTKKKRKGTHKVEVYKVNKNDIDEIIKGKNNEI